jgi:hypothetical protein
MLGLLAGCARIDATSMKTDYDKSVADYRACIAVKPASACEGQRHIMEANQRVSAAATRRGVTCMNLGGGIVSCN